MLWTQKTGYSFGSFHENDNVDILLPITNDGGGYFTLTIISGSLPPGLSISSTGYITGIISTIPINHNYLFCIRAMDSFNNIQDRSFYMNVSKLNNLSFITPSGNLTTNITLNNTKYSFQIQANNSISFILSSGSLPTGLSLSNTGLISGIITDVFSNTTFTFIIQITDGFNNFLTRSFSLFVYKDNYFTADNSYIKSDTTHFTADINNIISPIWLTDNNLGTYLTDNNITIEFDTYNSINTTYELVLPTDNWNSNTTYNLNNLVIYNNVNYICILQHTSTTHLDSTKWIHYGLPIGLTFYNNGYLSGYLVNQHKNYTFILKATNSYEVFSFRTFTISIVNISQYNNLSFITNSNLGNLQVGVNSELLILANTSLPNSSLFYYITSGALPTGLYLLSNGEIIGNPTLSLDNLNECIFDNELTTFDTSTDFDFFDVTSFDNNTTSFDTLFDNYSIPNTQNFIFNIQVSDIYGNKISNNFSLMVTTPKFGAYNLIIQPFLSVTQRKYWFDFINDNTIFTPSKIYRCEDSNFGIQKFLQSTIIFGLEGVDTNNYYTHIGNNKNMFFDLSTFKKISLSPSCELIYVEILDYSNKISYWKSLFNSFKVDDSYLPSYTLSNIIPICYCNGGEGDNILHNITNSNFDISLLNYEIDRFILKSINSNNTNKYLLLNRG